MNDLARKRDDWTSTSGNVVQFQTTSPSSSSGLLNFLNVLYTEDEVVSKRFKQFIEGEILDAYIKRSLWEGLHSIDDPFNAIYISELQPDHINRVDVQNINSYAQIRDLSDTIEFSDGWDD